MRFDELLSETQVDEVHPFVGKASNKLGKLKGKVSGSWQAAKQNFKQGADQAHQTAYDKAMSKSVPQDATDAPVNIPSAATTSRRVQGTSGLPANPNYTPGQSAPSRPAINNTSITAYYKTLDRVGQQQLRQALDQADKDAQAELDADHARHASGTMESAGFSRYLGMSL